MNVGAVRLFLRCSVVKLEQHCHPVHFIIGKNTLHHKWKCRYFCSSAMSSHIDCANSNDSCETDEFENEPLYGDLDFSKLTSDPAQLRALKLLAYEVELMHQCGEEVPQQMNMKHWAELLAFSSSSLRQKYLRIMRRREIVHHEVKMKKAEMNKLYLEKKASQPLTDVKLTTSSPIEYDLNCNSLFFRINRTRINRYNDRQLFNAMKFGSHIVIDCGYERYMSRLDLKHCVHQIQCSWSYNREQPHPYHIVFCNVNPRSVLLEKLNEIFPKLRDPAYPFFQTPKSYLDLYPKEQLLYLSPHASKMLQYDPNDVYIIGAYVDYCQPKEMSLAKAKKEGLRTAKFPIDMYLNWAVGTKSLRVNQVLAIMMDVKAGRGWKFAFRHIPRRKLRECEEGMAKRAYDVINKYM